MEIDLNEVEARKENRLKELLAKGWRREDLTWMPPSGTPSPRPAVLPTTRVVHVYDEAKGTFRKETESMTPERAERAWERHRKYEEKMALGMWTINGDAVTRRNRERTAASFDMARSVLVRRWPAEAEAMHAALTAVAARHERKLTPGDRKMLLDEVDALANGLPPEAAEIVRLAKLSYVGEPKYQDELRVACERLGC
jgi:hypothetical protein